MGIFNYFSDDSKNLRQIRKAKKKRNIEFLISNLKKTYPLRNYLMTVAALGQLIEPAGLDILLKELKMRTVLSYEQTKVMVQAIIKALGVKGFDKAIDTLVRLLKEQYVIYGPDAADSLKRIGWKPGNEEEEDLLIGVNKSVDEIIGLGKNIFCHIAWKWEIEKKKKALGILLEQKLIWAVEGIALLVSNEIISDFSLEKDVIKALQSIGGPTAEKKLIDFLLNYNLWSTECYEITDNAAEILSTFESQEAYHGILKACIAKKISQDSFFRIVEQMKEPSAIIFMEIAKESAIAEKQLAVDAIEILLTRGIIQDSKIKEEVDSFIKIEKEKLHTAADKCMKKAMQMSENEKVEYLKKLCTAYADNLDYHSIEELGKAIGMSLHMQGGKNEMRRIYEQIVGQGGSRTLDMLWNGIGDWRG